MSTLLSIVAIALYLAATAAVAWRLVAGVRGTTHSKLWVLVPVLLALVAHALGMYHRLIGPVGVNLGFFNALSVVAWAAVLLLTAFSLRRPVENLGLVILPFAALTLGLERLFRARAPVTADTPWGLQAHVLVSIVAYSLLTIAAVQAVALAIQDHQLRSRHPSAFIRGLPPLQTMEALLFRLIEIGFVFLSLALLSGVLFLEDIFAQHLVHKTVLSIAAWVVFGVLLVGRWRAGWRGRVAIRWTLGGFVVLMLAYFGSKLVLELVLSP